jgi:hypothetical protein
MNNDIGISEVMRYGSYGKDVPSERTLDVCHILGNGELLLQSLGNAADNPKGCWSDLHKH